MQIGLLSNLTTDSHATGRSQPGSCCPRGAMLCRMHIVIVVIRATVPKHVATKNGTRLSCLRTLDSSPFNPCVLQAAVNEDGCPKVWQCQSSLPRLLAPPAFSSMTSTARCSSGETAHFHPVPMVLCHCPCFGDAREPDWRSATSHVLAMLAENYRSSTTSLHMTIS